MAKTKKVNVRFIEPHQPPGTDLYALLQRLSAAHHPHLAEVSLALLWRYGLRPDRDGRLILGRARKLSDLDRELQVSYDGAIELNFESWQTLREHQQEALLDHELSHFAVDLDNNGDPKTDERGRLVLRLRKHDIEEFRSVVERHGFYKEDIEEFVRTALMRQEATLFNQGGEPAEYADTKE